MPMKIAELFVDLGVKGDAKAVKAVGTVKTSMDSVASSSLEAKAAIIGVLYGLERLTSASNREGTSLVNFAAATALSTKKLQEWQYAGRQVGATNEEVAGSVANLQSKINDMIIGKGAPEGMKWLASSVDLSKTDLTDTFALMGKLQEFAQKFKGNPALIKSALQSFGLSDGVMTGMFRNAFRPDVFSRAPVYSDRSAQSLDRMRAQWGNLFNKWEHQIGNLNLKFGPEFIKELTEITPKILSMVDAFAKLIQQTHALRILGKAFEGWGLIFDKISETVEGQTTVLADPKKSTGQKAMDIMFGTGDQSYASQIGGMVNIFKAWMSSLPKGGQVNEKNNSTINQTINIRDDGTSTPGQIQNSGKKAAQEVISTLPRGRM